MRLAATYRTAIAANFMIDGWEAGEGGEGEGGPRLGDREPPDPRSSAAGRRVRRRRVRARRVLRAVRVPRRADRARGVRGRPGDGGGAVLPACPPVGGGRPGGRARAGPGDRRLGSAQLRYLRADRPLQRGQVRRSAPRRHRGRGRRRDRRGARRAPVARRRALVDGRVLLRPDRRRGLAGRAEPADPPALRGQPGGTCRHAGAGTGGGGARRRRRGTHTHRP